MNGDSPVWRIRIQGVDAWLGDIYEWNPLVCVGQRDALWWTDPTAAQETADRLAARPLWHRVVECRLGWQPRIWSWARPGTTCRQGREQQ